MRDKSKKLTVVNTGKKKVTTQNLIEKQSSSRPSVLPSITGMAGTEYLLKSIWDSVFEIKTDDNGQKYIYGKLPVVTQYGVTMYADNGTLDIPSIYDGLPIDNNTLVWKEGVLMVNPDIEFGLNEDELSEYLTTHKYITDAYVDKSISTLEASVDKSIKAIRNYVDSNFVTFANNETITGIKDFTKGIKIDGLPITKLQDDVLYIDSNVVIRGGLTMYYENGEIDLPSIKDEIGFAGYDGATGLASFDSSQFSISSDGTVTIIGGSTGLDTTQLKDYLDSNKYTTETWVNSRINDLINGAPSAYDTLKEIADVLEGNINSIGDIVTTLGTKANKDYVDTELAKYLPLKGGTMQGHITLPNKMYIRTESNSYAILGMDGNKYILAAPNKPTTIRSNGTLKHNEAIIWDANTLTSLSQLINDADFTTNAYVNSTFVTLGTKQTITGEKNFTGGLRVNNSPSIYYDEVNKYWKLEGDLLVTGGVSMYSDDSAFTPSTIMDALELDNTTIRRNPTSGVLEVIGGSGATVKYPLSWSGFSSGSYDGSVAQSFYIPTKLSEFLNDSGFITSASIPTKLSQLTDDVVSGKYLPLTGGTVTGDVRLNCLYGNVTHGTLLDKNGSFIVYPINNATVLGAFGDGTTPNIATYIRSTGDNLYHRKGNYNSYNDYKIWDAGNDGSGSGLDADLLDGLQPSELNVGSATKLQTARTIWGQSFDGSANVSGNLTLDNSSFILAKNTSGTARWILGLSNENELVFGGDTAALGYDTVVYGNNTLFRYGTSKIEGIRLTSLGNVLIGTTTDSGYKLDVNGDVRIGNTTSANLRLARNSINYIIGGSDNSATNASIALSVGGSTQNIALLINNQKKATFYSDVDINTKLTINSIPIYKSQDDVLYIDANLVVRGGVTMYGENEVDIPTLMDAIAVDATMYNEGGILGVVKASTTKAGAAMFDSNFFSVDANGLVTLTNAPSSVSTLGSLLNVDVSLDSTATVNRVLYQAAGSSTWTWKELTSSGVTGDYLPLSGGQMTGDIGILLTPGTRTIGVPAAGTYEYSTSTYDDLPTHRSFIGTVYNTSNGNWWNVISCRHRNGDGDGRQYGMYLTTHLTAATSDLYWARQHYDGWQEERTILDTYNWRDHVMQNGTLDVIGGSTLGNFPAIRFVIHNTNWSQFVMGSDGTIWLVGGSNQDATYSGRAGLVTGNLRGTSILSDGGITMYSDIRKKQKLQDVELSLSQIANAPLIEHYYLSDQDKTTHVGSIAQYWAGLNDWFCKLDNEGYYTMEIQNAALASAISIARHLERYESKTDKKIRQLKKRISQLEDKIEKLEGA